MFRSAEYTLTMNLFEPKFKIKRTMKILIGDEEHTIIYIEYQEGIPYSVITTQFIPTAKVPNNCPHSWDFFLNEGDKNDLRAYNSGFGGDATKIPAPQYIDGCTGVTYWISDGVEFEGEPKNIKKLKHPRLLKGFENSRNPFKIAEITNSCEYCDRCGHHSTEFCYEHKYDDDEGNPRYIDDDSYAD